MAKGRGITRVARVGLIKSGRRTGLIEENRGVLIGIGREYGVGIARKRLRNNSGVTPILATDISRSPHETAYDRRPYSCFLAPRKQE